MTNVTTNETRQKEFSTLASPKKYMEALEEAAIFIQSHEEGKNLPEEILVKALGPQPPYCDCTNINSMLDTRETFKKYQQDKELFIKRAVVFSQ